MEKKRISNRQIFDRIDDKQERMTAIYYRYYIADGSDPWFITPLKSNINKSSNELVFNVGSYFLNKAPEQPLSIKGESSSKDASIRNRVFGKIMKMMQNEMIVNKAFIPLPFGLGELTVGTSITSGIYSKKSPERNPDNHLTKHVNRYAVNTRGKMFRFFWYKARIKHTHARYYRFEPALGSVDPLSNKKGFIYYGTQGLAARIMECNNSPDRLDYTANYI